jgi:hypothetical protein
MKKVSVFYHYELYVDHQQVEPVLAAAGHGTALRELIRLERRSRPRWIGEVDFLSGAYKLQGGVSAVSDVGSRGLPLFG